MSSDVNMCPTKYATLESLVQTFCKHKFNNWDLLGLKPVLAREANVESFYCSHVNKFIIIILWGFVLMIRMSNE